MYAYFVSTKTGVSKMMCNTHNPAIKHAIIFFKCTWLQHLFSHSVWMLRFRFDFFKAPPSESVVGLDWSANQSVVIGLLLRACVGKVKPLSIIGMLYLQKHCKYYCNYANLHMWDLWWTFQNTTFFIRLLHSGSPCNNVFQKQRFLNSLTTTFVWGWAKIVNRRCYANVLHAVVTLLK